MKKAGGCPRNCLSQGAGNVMAKLLPMVILLRSQTVVLRLDWVG